MVGYIVIPRILHFDSAAFCYFELDFGKQMQRENKKSKLAKQLSQIFE